MPTVRLAVAAVVFLSLCAPPPARAETVIDPSEPPGLKSPGTALALSLGTTAASWAAIGLAMQHDSTALGAIGMLGAYFGPSAGHVYAGKPFTRGFAARTLGAVAVMGGLAASFDACGLGSHCDTPPLSTALVVAGVAGLALGTLDDIVRAPAAVRSHNARIRELAVAPAVGHRSVALVAGGRF